MKTMTLFNSIACELEVIYRNPVRSDAMPKISSSDKAHDILRSIWNDQINLYESFYVLYLNRGNKVIGYRCISQGGVSSTVVDPKTIFQAALLCNASSILLAHNHPSGNTIPSETDIALTKKIKAAGEFLDITVIDHLILTDDRYYSFADEGTI